jgi:esterase/lipase
MASRGTTLPLLRDLYKDIRSQLRQVTRPTHCSTGEENKLYKTCSTKLLYSKVTKAKNLDRNRKLYFATAAEFVV